jgi:hypothetical protein
VRHYHKGARGLAIGALAKLAAIGSVIAEDFLARRR